MILILTHPKHLYRIGPLQRYLYCLMSVDSGTAILVPKRTVALAMSTKEYNLIRGALVCILV